MAQITRSIHAQGERGDEADMRFLEGIEWTLRTRGTAMQRVLCTLMMAVLTGARLPGGGYGCQLAMFAVLIKRGMLVPPAFAGMMIGFAVSYGMGEVVCCWQLPAATLLWLTGFLWIRKWMPLAVFLAEMTAGAVMGVDSPLAVAVLLLTSATGAGLSALYDGAALSAMHRDELDGQTRPLCVMAVCASLLAGLMPLPGGSILALALAGYLTLEHAYVGGAPQAVLCAGVLGTVLSLGLYSANPLAMLLCGGFLASAIKTDRRSLCALLMALGMAAASAVMGGDFAAVRLFLFCLPGFAPFLLLSSARRSAVTGLIEREEPEEMTQSEAVAVRCASMIHAWAKLYEETARMMKSLSAGQKEDVEPCVRLLEKTSASAHQVCERTLSEIHPDDDAYRRIRYALLREGMEEVRVAYALRMGERMEVMLLKPEAVAAVSLQALVSRACGVAMRPCRREGILGTQAVFEQAPALHLEIGAATRSRSGEDVAGDSYISRALPGGRHVLALSDGMGSGVSALEESHMALKLLCESLSAGYTRAQALDVVNALMLLCTGREMYATMDLCVLNLHTGETAFEKLGACASYVVREGEVRAIGADTLPVGVLPDVEARSLRMTLHPGDVIVMLTDGVADAYPGGESALREAVLKLAWLHPQAVGERLIADALGEGEAKDDMAVLCARVSKERME